MADALHNDDEITKIAAHLIQQRVNAPIEAKNVTVRATPTIAPNKRPGRRWSKRLSQSVVIIADC